MRVLIVSKALVNGMYREKLTQLGMLGIQIIAAVPPEWREGGGSQRLEESAPEGYSLIQTPIRLNGHFHLHYYPSLPRLIRDIKPDLVHVDEEPFNLATFHAVRAARRAGIPSLFFSWQNLLRRYPPPFSLMERFVYATVVHAIAGSEEAVAVLRTKGFRKPVSVISQFGVDPDLFQPGPRQDRPFTVGFFNRLISAKAPLLALEAFSLLPGDAQMRYVGDGPLRPELEREIESRGLANRVTVVSRIPSTEMPAAVRSVDAIVLPSLTTSSWKEQFGRILQEGMASGVAVVGSDSGEIPRVIGDAGIVVPEGNAQILGEALRQLANDVTLREELGTKGRERVLAHFTHVRVAQKTAEVYRQALDDTSGS